ncbi:MULTISPECIES: hypothetical protein [unclassified Avibacterium]|uniref:hypothetical protein n=1 Tax=unclassified Avibacterium TaxID=2685287 RepID=UPI002026EB6E|nr:MULTISPECIES: hypothetical protein [unclassified Avibacterium]MCW9718427.1 hypothetical protein [Avibacterium sp. 21-599]URL05646.1 hypothetical protein L4F92_06025 [Avibacterium sp. 21-595]
MLNLFKRPIEIETLEAWAKMSEDMAKVAILAVPMIIFGQNGTLFKIISSFTLVFIAYATLAVGKQLRKLKPKLSKED